MEQHPIEGLMRTALENIKDMVDVSTVVGDPIDTGSGIFMVPICKVSCGFISGGSEFGGLEISGSGGGNGNGNGGNNSNNSGNSQQKESNPQSPAGLSGTGSARPTFPFGGGSGAGVGITPIGFLVVQGDQVRLVTSDSTVNLVERVADLTPKAIEKLKQVLSKNDGAASSAGDTKSN